MNRQTENRSKATATVVAILASAALAACGSDDSTAADTAAAAPAPSYDAALKQAPAKLARLYANGSELIVGGEAAFNDTLASVEGYPVVVNHWGSWCGPCREEFPYFQDQSAEHLDEVAFVGIDTEDSPAAYDTFLEENPIPYPSVEDPDGEFSSWTGTPLFGQPNTLFYDERGELVFTHQGPYTSEEDLAADIEKYALGATSSASS